MKHPIPLRRLLSLQFGLAAALPVMLIAFLVWLFLIPSLKTQTTVWRQGMARSVAGQITSHLKGGERQLKALVDFFERQQPPFNHFTSLMDSECGNGEFFEAIYDSVDLVRLKIGK